MTAEPDDLERLMALLAELGRLDLDLLVRDLAAPEAVQTLQVLRDELQEILKRADHGRRGLRALLAARERELAGVWPGAAAAEILRGLSGIRRSLVELDLALQPAQVLHDELTRRCSRRLEASAPAPGEPAGADRPKDPSG